MSVVAVCTGCQKAFKAPDDYAGKKVKCKNCGTTFRVPGPAVAASPAGRAPASAAPAVARSASAPAAVARTAAARKPVAPPPVADDEGGEYGLSDDELGPVQQAPVMPPTASAPRQTMAAPALAYASPGTANTVARPGVTMFPSGVQTVASRQGAAAAAVDAHNWLLYVQLAAFGLPVLLLVLGKLIPAIGMLGVILGTFVGMAFIIWGQIGILIAASQEGSGTLLMYIFIPLYWVFFILSHFDDVSSHVIRTVGGFALIFGSVMLISSLPPA
jgi:hypothetical protein